MKNLAIAFSAVALMSGPALAQSQWVELEDNVVVAPFSSTADQVEDWDVYDANGQKIGDVESVLGRDPSTATALVIDFDDGAAFVDGDVIVPIEQFTWQNNRLSLDIDQAAAQQLELWND